MTSFLSELEQTYDYIFIDMPPRKPVVEGLSIGSVLDGLLIVSEWNKTPMYLVQDLTRRLRETNTNILGVPDKQGRPWPREFLKSLSIL